MTFHDILIKKSVFSFIFFVLILFSSHCGHHDASTAANVTYSLNTSPSNALTYNLDGNFQFIGRNTTYGSNTNNIVMAWPATAVSIAFQNGSLDLAVAPNPADSNLYIPLGGLTFSLYVDGNRLETYILTQPSLLHIASPKGDNQWHDVWLIKETEAANGSLLFQGLASSTTANLKNSTRLQQSKFIEVYGDSISAGYGLLKNANLLSPLAPYASNSNAQFLQSLTGCHASGWAADPNYELASATYAVKTAMHYNAQWSILAWSGKGIYKNSDSNQLAGPSAETLPQLANLANPLDTTTTYTYPNRAPDIILINLGTNDFTAMSYDSENNTKTLISETDKANFKSSYQAFIEQLWIRAPNAFIVLAAGPMLSDYISEAETGKIDAQFSLMKLLLNQIILAEQAAHPDKASRISLLTFSVDEGILCTNNQSLTYPPAAGCASLQQYISIGCDYHPNLNYHQYMAFDNAQDVLNPSQNALSNCLENIMHW